MNRTRTNDRSSRTRTGGSADSGRARQPLRLAGTAPFRRSGRSGGYGRRPAAVQGEFALPKTITPALPAVEAFADLDMPDAAAGRRSAAQGVTVPFPIQAATLPNALAGRDVLGRGRTGSGKTLAFGLALLARTAGQRAEPRQPLALVLVPTRELAQQVTDALTPYARAVQAAAGHRRRRDVDRPAGRRAARRRRGRRRDPGPAQGPHRPRRLPAGPGRASPCWTRPTRWPTWASCRRSPRCSTRCAPTGSGCCSPPPWTATSTCWSAAT